MLDAPHVRLEGLLSCRENHQQKEGREPGSSKIFMLVAF